jgi:16S rRNA (cytosine967-C5)-methyltransferase
MAMNRKTVRGDRQSRMRDEARFPRKTSPALATEPAHTSLAELTAAIAPAVLHRVVREHKWLAPSISLALADRGRIALASRASIARSLSALLRWWGWIEPLHLPRIEEQLLLAWLLDSTELNALARIWAERSRLRPDSLVPVGDAPNWTGRAEGLKRFLGGRAVNADPWLLFPAWLRNELPVPPGALAPKVRRLEFLGAVQARPPLWLGVRGADEKAVWGALRDAGLKPWIHRRVPTAAKLPAETDLLRLDDSRAGRLVAHDIASQAVALVCDPDPGERWWDVSGESGLIGQHIASLMHGKGVVVCTFEQDRRRHEAALRIRRGPLRNVSTRLWDGRHPPGKSATFDGVVVDAISSAVGSWRRHPDARWTITAPDIPNLAARQLQSLALASEAVRPGGFLIYTVPTVTRSETVAVVQAFLGAHPEFQLDPFPHPLEEGTTGGMLQIWPQAHDGEARFIARLVRRANKQDTTSAKKAKRRSSALSPDPDNVTIESLESSTT